MAFDDVERSDQDGQPVELYEFNFMNAITRFTSAMADYEFDLQTWTAVALQRTNIEKTSELPKANIKLTAPHNFAVSELWRVGPPSDIVHLTIYQVHHTDTGEQAIVKWKGRVLNAEWSGSQVELSCESIFTSLKRFGLRRQYSRMCPHILYGSACKLVNTVFQEDMVLTGADGVSLQSPSFLLFADGWFAGGYVQWERTVGTFEKRAIKAHVGDTVEITHPIQGLEPGQTIEVFPGCAHNMTDCAGKFNNLPNYGGFPFIPQKNPFGGPNVY